MTERRYFNEDWLSHYQVKGAKHGVRRYQNRDGSLTPLGRVHYGIGVVKQKVKDLKRKNNLRKARAARKKKKADKERRKEWLKTAKDIEEHWDEFDDDERAQAIVRLSAEKTLLDYKKSKIEKAKKIAEVAAVYATIGMNIAKATDQLVNGKKQNDRKKGEYDKDENASQSDSNDGEYIIFMDDDIEIVQSDDDEFEIVFNEDSDDG